MPPLAMLTSVAAMWMVAVAIPGPNFFTIARLAAMRSRGAALAGVAGLGLGSLCWGLAGLFGLHAMFVLAPMLYGALKLAGALYLILLGARILVASLRPAVAAPAGEAGPAFRLGLLTSLSNPKSALLVGSLFAAVLPAHAPVSVGLAMVAEMVAISVGWYAILACAIGSRPVAAAYARARRALDRLAGVVFIGFGARLVLESR
jgi:threonine/homoserine/homoserine lactone efflux protein